MSISKDLIPGLANILKHDTKWIKEDQKAWAVLGSYLSAGAMSPSLIKSSFDCTKLLLNKSFVNLENYGEAVDLLLSFPSSAATLVASGALSKKQFQRDGGAPEIESLVNDVVTTCLNSLNHLYEMHRLIEGLCQENQIQSQRAFYEFWLPILSGLAQQCYHPIREIRQQAFALLQKTLVSPDLEAQALGTATSASKEMTVASPAHSSDIWSACFDSVLFPLLDELLRPDAFLLDPAGMDETRARAFAMLCKMFLHLLPRMLRAGDLSNIWDRILDLMGRYLSVSKNDYLVILFL